jgi:peroxiredoxin
VVNSPFAQGKYAVGPRAHSVAKRSLASCRGACFRGETIVDVGPGQTLRGMSAKRGPRPLTPEARKLRSFTVTKSAIFGALLLSSAAFTAGCASEKAEPFDDGSSIGDDAKLEERLPYPSAPFGATEGAVIANYRFLGWHNPDAASLDLDQLAPVSLAHFYDPDGTKGIKYLMITSTAVWCSACKAEYKDMAKNVAAYQKRGVQFMGALFEDNDSDPAQPSDLVNWARAYTVKFPFVLDPQLKLGSFFDVEATPMVMVVDTKTMQITKVEEGWAATGPQSLWTYLDGLPGM